MSRRWWLALPVLIGCMAIAYGITSHSRRNAAVNLGRQCREFSAAKNWESLARASQTWSEVEPQKADPWLFRAEAAEAVKDWENVVRFLDRIPRTDSRMPAALVRKAVAEFEVLNRPWDGVRTCDELLEIEPRVLIAHKQTIFFFAMTLQRKEMVRRIRQAIHVRRESPESYVYLISASWLYSGSLYRHNNKWLESDPDSELFQVGRAMQVYASQAKTDLEHKAEFEHIPEPEALLERYPHNLELVAWFLNRSISEGDLDRVRELLLAVPSDIADGDARFWRARAWCEDADGDFDQAEASLRQAFELDPYWWQIHFQLHDLFRRLGRLDESAHFFKLYQTSKGLSTTIRTLEQSVEALDQRNFLRSARELAGLVKDDEVAQALDERLKAFETRP